MRENSQQPHRRPDGLDAAPSLAWLLEMLAGLNGAESLDVILRPSGARSRSCQVHLPPGERAVLAQLLVILRRLPDLPDLAEEHGPKNVASPAGDPVDRHGRDADGLTALQRAIIDHLETTPGNKPLAAKVIASRMGRPNSGQFRKCLRELADAGRIGETDEGGRFFAVEDFGDEDFGDEKEDSPDDGRAEGRRDGMAGK